MANLKTCSRCKSNIDISFFGLSRKKEPYKTCDNCRNKKKEVKQETPESPRSCVSTDTIANLPEPEKYIIVVDVETNGLIRDRNIQPSKSNLVLFPHIVQFSWGLYTMDGECKDIKDYIIKPDGWTMNGSERFHGITQERALEEGVDIKEVLENYKNDINNKCLKIVCHNVNFDLRVIKSELLRADMEINDIDAYCTMKESVNYCKISPRVRGEYKWPTLEQLYYKCFDKSLNNAHNSYYDVLNCAQCYFALQKNI